MSFHNGETHGVDTWVSPRPLGFSNCFFYLMKNIFKSIFLFDTYINEEIDKYIIVFKF